MRMKAKTAVERMQQQYPGMSQSVYSMARNPEKYGVRLTPVARKLAGYISTPELDKAQRAKPHRMTFRVSDRVYAALQEICGSKKIPVQAMMEKAVLHYYGIKEDKNADL